MGDEWAASIVAEVEQGQVIIVVLRKNIGIAMAMHFTRCMVEQECQ